MSSSTYCFVVVRFACGNPAGVGAQWEHFLCAAFRTHALSCMLAMFTFFVASLPSAVWERAQGPVGSPPTK